MNRTDFNGNLRLTDAGREVHLYGWMANRRHLGSLLFIDLRDSTGIVQLTIQCTREQVFAIPLKQLT